MLIRILYKNIGIINTKPIQYIAKNCLGTKKYNEYDFLLENLQQKSMLDCRGELIPATTAFRRKPIIAYYFSASWCMPCKILLPKIKEMYTVCHKKPNGFELIYVSMDESQDIMVEYFQHAHGCEWFAIPCGDSAREVLLRRFDIDSVPQIIAVKVSDGSIITTKARKDIEELGNNVLLKWNPE